MKNWHTEKFVINDTNVDFNETVSVVELMKLFQVATFNHSQKIELDHKTMIDKSNAFWVVTKMKLVLNKEIYSQEKISVTTWTHELGNVRALRDCVFKSGKLVKVKGNAEWCCLDMETRKLRKFSSIIYPNLEMEKTKNNNLSFTNLREEVTEKDFVYKKTIMSSDIDINNHTNNMVYNRIALDAFNVKELRQMQIKEYEIYFINESYEGDVVEVFKKKVKQHYYIEGKIQDKTIFRVVIKLKKREC